MGTFAAGQVVILPFSFSDLTARKYQPALLLAAVGKGDWIRVRSPAMPMVTNTRSQCTTRTFPLAACAVRALSVPVNSSRLMKACFPVLLGR